MTSMVAERGPARCNTLPKTSLHSMIRISLQLISLFACILLSLLFALLYFRSLRLQVTEIRGRLP